MTQTLDSDRRTNAVATIHGRILDPDSHLMLPPASYAYLLGERWGPAFQAWAEAKIDSESRVELDGSRPQTRDRVWARHNWAALGAADVSERLEALDLMGVARQLVFPATMLPTLHGTDDEADATLRRYNDFVLAWAEDGDDRLRPVAQLPARRVAETVAEAERVLSAGALAVELPFSSPPGGLSPAGPEWDALWSLLAAAGAPLMLHVGGGGLGTIGGAERSLLDPRWGEAELLRQGRPGRVQPYATDGSGAFGCFDVAILHIPAEVFLTAVVLGGVLERHPGLHIGVVELGAQWVGGWVQRLDAIWAGTVGFSVREISRLVRKPSFYVRRQLRVSPSYGEPVGRYIERDGLAEVYVFSSDYPHDEGGDDPVERFGASIAPLGNDVVEQFFVTNSEELLPA